MTRNPKTPEDAAATRYGEWAGNRQGRPFDPKCCAAHITTAGRGGLPAQCGAKPGQGPHGLFCKTHALELTEEVFPVWSLCHWNMEIMERQAVSETEKTFTLRSGDRTSRTNKVSDYESLFRTKEAAVAEARRRIKSKLKAAKQDVQKWTEALEKITP